MMDENGTSAMEGRTNSGDTKEDRKT